jgi:hypothetical protein
MRSFPQKVTTIMPAHLPPATPTGRIPLLIVMNGDGFGEIYGDRSRVDIRVISRPSMQSQQGEILADDYVSLALPPRHRELFYPGSIITTFTVRDISPLDIANTMTETAFLRGIDHLMQACKEAAA